MLHNEYELIIKRRIDNIIFSNMKAKVYVYPYGRLGEVVVQLLEEKGIKAIPIDNKKSDIISIDNFQPELIDLLIISSNSQNLYNDIRENVKLYVEGKCRIIDLFPLEKVCSYCQDNEGQNIFHMEYYDMNMFLPVYKTDYIQNFIYTYGVYFDEVNLAYVNKFISSIDSSNNVVLDIGANIGNHSMYFAKEMGFKKVLSFEPIKSTYDLLCENVKINNYKDVIYTYNLAVTNKNGKAEIDFYDETNIGGTSIIEDDEGEITTITIDEFLKGNEERISFIKIDTEGYELAVIEGGYDTIKKWLPYIYIEIKGNENYVKISEKLFALGYSFNKLTEQDYFFFVNKQNVII